ncbi:uncharacterized protein BYT42DRAFT_31072 [Radiomyces spectabilis]|uniref:uncharacterized protein n=1 Tax=Radiomyces spectabilis TaxID=64574 RepID=UPI0022206D3E|nr:uncharacterized protein BYT42DRAFT_31072 [Radiomyces spectabilis]KAI8394111.1 hypothetical protein BYT42DRAFT_31072 [Radiomyces spectabilis]
MKISILKWAKFSMISFQLCHLIQTTPKPFVRMGLPHNCCDVFIAFCATEDSGLLLGSMVCLFGALVLSSGRFVHQNSWLPFYNFSSLYNIRSFYFPSPLSGSCSLIACFFFCRPSLLSRPSSHTTLD